MEEDDWQEMPVVRQSGSSSSASSDDDGSNPSQSRRSKNKKYSVAHSYRHGTSSSSMRASNKTGLASGATNATGRHLNVDDARGYDWRAKPKTAEEEQRASKSKKKASKGFLGRKKKPEGSESSSSSSLDSDDEEVDDGGIKGYTQLRFDDDPDLENLDAATDYLFTGGAGTDNLGRIDATPQSQLNTTKSLLSEGQKIAYVGLVSLSAKSIIRQLQRVPGKELKAAISSAEEWRLRVMARIFQHMDIETGEQLMIESLAEHGVLSQDLSPSLITTQTVENPDFDPQAALEREEEQQREDERAKEMQERDETHTEADPHITGSAITEGSESLPEAEDSAIREETHTTDVETSPGINQNHLKPAQETVSTDESATQGVQALHGDIVVSQRSSSLNVEPDSTVQGVLQQRDDIPQPTKVDPNTATRIETNDNTDTTPLGLTNQPQTIEKLPSALDGVTTELSSADKTITLDLRWTVLCDLFLVLTADSVYDSRSRVLLEKVAEELGLTWMDVTKFEKRVTDALEIEEGVSGSLKGKKAVRKRAEMARRRRLVMMGLATVGGGLVIGLSAGAMAPLIGAGLGAALGTVGIGGTSTFLGGVGGAALITGTGTIGGAALGGTGMSKRTRNVRTFEFKPIHNNKRVNCIITVPGFMNGEQDDPRLPFSVVDSIMGDIFSLLWEPDMMHEMGNAMNLLWNETIVQGIQQALALTVAGGLVGALAFPLWLTKLGYFIDNPWSNALDRAHACGLILADVLAKRKIGVRPVTLVGFSLGARVIFYALVELARTKKFGIVQNVYLMGAPVTANDKTWKEARSIVAGRFVNAFSRTDWILGYLFRATTAGIGSIAGLRPVERVPEVENVDVTQTVPGHLQYRAFMPLVLDQLGFRTTADYFDEPEDLNTLPEREVVYDDPEERHMKSVKTSSGGFGMIWNRRGSAENSGTTTPTKAAASAEHSASVADDDLPPRETDDAFDQASESQDKADPGVDDFERPYVSPTSPAGSEQAQQVATPRAGNEMDDILAELRENGIEVKELESSLPPLVTTFQGKTDYEKVAEPDSPLTIMYEKANTGTVGQTTLSPNNAVDYPPTSTATKEEQPTSSTRPYARRFGSTVFDNDELPPSCPEATTSTDVDLSFGESYEADVFDGESVHGRPEPGSAELSLGASGNQSDSSHVNGDPLNTYQTHDFSSARSQYGLSPEAARELAMQFESSGMSASGAHAASRLAHNFEALEITDGGARPPPTYTSIYHNASLSGGSRAQTNLSGESSDPWSGSRGLIEEDQEHSSFAPDSAKSEPSITVPTSTHAWNHDNPWD